MTANELPVVPPAVVESRRLAAVVGLDLLDTAPEERFDRITRLVAQLLDTDVALLNLIARERQWAKSAFGASREDVPRVESLCSVVVVEDRPLVVEDLQRAPRFASYPVVAAGRRFYAGLPLHDLAGQPVGTLCVLDDEPRSLTPRDMDLLRSLATWAEAELNALALLDRVEQLSDAEQRLRQVLDGAPAGVLLLEGDGDLTWANAPAMAMFGVPLEGRPLSALLPALDVPELLTHGRRDGEHGWCASRPLAQVGVDADGQRFPVEVTASPLPGAADRQVVFVRDLRAERAQESDVAALQEQTAAVLNALAEGVFLLAHDGSISFCNLASARILHRRRSDLLGSDWHSALHRDACTSTPCPLVDPLALAGRRLSPVWIERRGHTALPVELSVRTVREGSGAAGVVVTVDDLTDRLRVDRLKDEFISSVSHELRTPLTSIRGSLGLLSAGVVGGDTEQGRRMMQVALESTDRLRRLVDDILDLERLQAGKVDLLLAPQRLDPLMALAAQAVSGVAVESDVLLDVQDSGLSVTADSDRVVQILVNLVGNAVKFSPPGSTVRLSAKGVGDRVHIAVADSGRGIPPDQVDRVFDRFAQVDGSDSRDQSGSGLGLAIALGLARQHGGDLSVTSTLGVGSTFVLDLPATGQQASAGTRR